MRLRWIGIAAGLLFFAVIAPLRAQKVVLGIAPAFDAGGDEFGEALVQHLTLFTYQDLLDSKQFVPVLLNPGGVYTPLDTSWLAEYVKDRPELDLLLVPVLKATVADKNSATVIVELSLLDAHTGDTKATWNVSETTKTKNAWLEKGESMVTSGVNDRSGRFGYEITPSRDFEKQPLGKTTAHLADEVRDTLAAHLGGATHAGDSKDPPAASGSSCTMHTRITYSYKHSASHSYTLMANGLDETTTVLDGVTTFKASEGPLLLQFTLNDAPYKLMKEPVYQLSAVHSCDSSMLIIDIGQQGDAHQHWE